MTPQGRSLPRPFPAVLMLGVISQVGQVLLLREMLMVFHGNELSIGLILGSWMVWVGLGSRLGAFMVERFNCPLLLLRLSSSAVAVILPFTMFLIRVLRGFFDIAPGAYLSLIDMALSSLLLLAPVCLLLGTIYVFLARIWRESESCRDTTGAGKTYVVEAAGNMIGGVLFTFVLVRFTGAFQSVFLVAVLLVAAVSGILYAESVNKYRSRRFIFAFVLFAVVLGGFPLMEEIDRRSTRLQWNNFMPDYELVENRQSKHGLISVARRGDQYTFFQSGHPVFTAAGPETPAPGLEEREAVEFGHLSMVQHENPRRVLLIGGGMGGLLGALLQHPVEKIDYVELDEVLTFTAREHLSRTALEVLDDSKVNLIHADGRLFVKTADDSYDMIVVDVPDPATAVLNRFYTREFFQESRALLNDGGVMVLGVGSTPDLRGTAIANRNTSIFQTLNDVFARVLPAGERRLFFFASDDPGQVTLDAAVLEERYRARQVETRDFSPEHYRVMLEENQLRRVNWVLRNHGRSSGAHLEGPPRAPIAPVSLPEQEALEKALPAVVEKYFINTDLKPIGYYYTLVHWDHLTRSSDDHILWLALQARWWWVLPLPVLLILFSVFLRAGFFRPGITRAGYPRLSARRPGLSFAVLLTVLTTGFSTMTLQVALLFSFQAVYGFVYETVGLIIAVFMGGLFVGAFIVNRFLRQKADFKLLALVQLLVAAYALALAVSLPGTVAVDNPGVVFTLFLLLTFFAGTINGTGFPLALACYLHLNGLVDRTAGTVYGFELLGACLGAVLTSVFLAPVAGIPAACILAAVVNLVAFVVILINRSDFS